MNLDEVMIEMGENYLKHVLQSIGSKFKDPKDIPPTYEEFVKQGGWQDPLGKWLLKKAVDNSDMFVRSSSQIKPENFRPDEWEMLIHMINKCGLKIGKDKKGNPKYPSPKRIIKCPNIRRNFHLLRKILSIEDKLKQTKIKCIYCNNPATEVSISSSHFSLFDKTNRKEVIKENVCFRHFLELMAASEDFFHSRDLIAVIGDGENKKTYYWSIIGRDVIVKRVIKNRLSSAIKDFIIMRMLGLGENYEEYFLVIHTTKDYNKTMDIYGAYPLGFLNKLEEIIKQNKSYAIDRTWGYLLSNRMVEVNGINYFYTLNSFISRGYISDDLIKMINRLFRKEGYVKGWKDILSTFIKKEVKNMGEINPLEKGWRVGAELRNMTAKEDKEKLEQIQKWIKSISEIMELSPDSFIKKLNEIFRKLGYRPISTEDIDKIAENKRARLLFVNGLLSGVYPTKSDTSTNAKGDNDE